jgi:hypothetical protein
MLKEYIIKEVFCINNGIVTCKTNDFLIGDIINTNVVFGTNTPFFQNFKFFIIFFESNGFMRIDVCTH